MTPPEPLTLPGDAPQWFLPGPLVARLVALAVLTLALVAGASAWLVARTSAEEARQRAMAQQSEEVEIIARLVAGKIEHSQKVLRTLAQDVTQSQSASLTQHGMLAARFFDAVQIAGRDGTLRLNLRAGKEEQAANLEPAERDTLRRTLVDGKPLVATLTAPSSGGARVMLTMPLHQDDGTVHGVVAGVLRLQSQGLLPPALAAPGHSESQLIVFTREGIILAHPDPARVMGRVQDEPGLAPLASEWLRQNPATPQRASTHALTEHLVSVASIPLPQWAVARVSWSPPLLSAVQGAQREAWRLVAAMITLGMVLLTVAMVWLAQPLGRLRLAADQLAHAKPSDPPPTWPSAGGEVHALTIAYQHLLEQSHGQRQHEAVLQEQLEAILDHASVGIVISRAGVLDVVGRQFCQMLDYAPCELRGQPARMLYASDADYACVGERVRDEFAAHGALDTDLCFTRKDGSPVWARVQGRALQPHDAAAGTVWIVEDITAAREARSLHNWEHTHDTLTQLYNRSAFEQRLHQLLTQRSQPAEAAPAGEGAVLYLDLDHFTLVNDLAGRDAGDDVLRHVARLLEAQVRRIGWAARLGGDEFAVVLPGCPLTRAQAVAEQLRAAIAAWEPSYQGRSFTLGASIGLVGLDLHLPDVAAVLHAADMACYQAKREGRNRVHTCQASEAANSGRVSLV